MAIRPPPATLAAPIRAACAGWRRDLLTRFVMPLVGRMLPRARRHRARGARGRHRLVGRRALPRRARLAAPARLPRRGALRRGARLPRRSRRGDLPRASTTGTIFLRGDLPPAVWERLRRERFFGMIIPEEWGGLGFSAQAHSAVIVKLASRSVACAVTVMVPNSLGPAELLLHYGTDEQKRHYLPRLARGEEIPVLRADRPRGRQRRRRDAERGHRLPRQVGRPRGARHPPALAQALHHARAGRDGDRARLPPARPRPPARRPEDLGITCALVPAKLPGIEIGARHDPMGVPFLNGPTRGDDVFVPLDAIIGGREGAGQGWRMLMESLVGGALDLAALALGRRREARDARGQRLRDGARAVRHADRPLRGRRGAGRAHRRARPT